MIKKYVFSFVILNYITFQDTIECVNSIKKFCSNNKYYIIIVDNASPNESGVILKEKYKYDKNIKLIINKENYGFARGNNIGFRYAKENNKSDFIILCNSDTEVLDSSFCDKIISKYEDTSFALLGPKEKLKDGGYYFLMEKARSKRRLKLDICLFNNVILNKPLFFLKFLLRVNNFFEGKKKLDVNKEYKNICLHGAFLIFSRKYIDLFDGLNDITYLYGEEEFLFWRLKKYNLLSIYYPKIVILHKSSSSTKMSISDEKQRKIRQARWHMDSSKKLLKALDGGIKI